MVIFVGYTANRQIKSRVVEDVSSANWNGKTPKYRKLTAEELAQLKKSPDVFLALLA